MPRVSYTAEQAVLKLREYDVLITQGKTQVEVCKEIGVSKDTIARWRKEFGGMQVDHVKRLKELEKENDRLKKIVANLSLDNAILKEVSRGNF